MAYDDEERMNADQKEVTQDEQKMGNREPDEFSEEFSEEFAADSWMSAVMIPDSVNQQETAKTGETQEQNQDVAPTNNQEQERDFSTEASAEFAAPDTLRNDSFRDDRATQGPQGSGEVEEMGAGSSMGIVGLGLSLLSLFLLPFLFAPAAIVLGYLAYRKNATTLGAWSMIIGAVSLLGTLLIYPFFVR